MTEYAIIISFLLSILVVAILFYFYRKWLIKNTDEDEVEKMTRKEILEKTIDFDDAVNRIVRLEKENTELKLKLEALEGQIPWKDIKDKSELIKENTELKEKLEIEQNARGDWFGKAVTKDRRLNEAKELLKEMIDTPVFNQMGGELYENEGYTELVTEVEQFLSEVEK